MLSRACKLTSLQWCFTWVLLENKTDIEKLFLEIHHDTDCSKELDGKQGDAYSQGRYYPLYNCYLILCSLWVYCFQCQKPSKVPQFRKLMKISFSLGGDGPGWLVCYRRPALRPDRQQRKLAFPSMEKVLLGALAWFSE